MENKVLVFCPTYRLEPETREAIFGIEFDCPRDYLFGADNPFKGGRENILYQYQKGRRVCLESDYSHLWTVESDIIPPPDAWHRLRAVEKPVVLGLYCFRPLHSGWDAVNATLWGGPSMGQSLSLHPEELEKVKGQVAQVTGLGLGCCLIEREVLERVEFRTDHRTHTDWTFMEDVRREKFEIWCDFGAICGHKDEDGVIYWPFGEEPRWFGQIQQFVPDRSGQEANMKKGFVKVRALTSFAGPFGAMSPLEVRDVPEHQAIAWIEAGLAEGVEDPAEKKRKRRKPAEDKALKGPGEDK